MKLSILKNKLLFCIISSLIVSLILSSLFLSGFLKDSGERLSDKLYSSEKPLSEIIILGIDDKSLNEIGRWPWSRQVFSDALEKLKEAKVIGVDVSFLEKEGNADYGMQKILEELEGKVVLASECSEFSNGKCSKWLNPIFNSTVSAVNVFVEHGTALAIPGEIDGIESFSRKISEEYLGRDLDLKGKNYIRFSEYGIISFSDIGNMSSDYFKNRIVLIGATARDLHDEQRTPIGILYGVEIHASAIKTMITNSFLEKQSVSSVIVWMFLLSICVSLLLYGLKFLHATLSSASLLVIYPIIAIFRFESGIVYNLFYPILSIILTYFAIVGIYYTLEARQRKWVSSVLGKYVSDSVAREIIEKGEEALKLKGSKKIVTVLFADIRGFTSMSEKMKPEEVVSTLNKYLHRMTEAVFRHGGTLDKYVGDEIMATYNVPLDLKDHAIMAVKSAIDMQRISRELRKELGNDLKYGVGINTGEAIVGNIGGEKRLDYTVIGDSVNLGARLCGKAEGDQIMISESTNELVKDSIKTKFIGEITVKGKEKPLKVYEVVY